MTANLTSVDEILADRGRQTIATGRATGEPVRFSWAESCWKQTFEYPAADFVREVGYFSEVFGFAVNTIDDGYAMFTNEGNDFHFSVRRADPAGAVALDGLKLCFMTDDLAPFRAALDRSAVAAGYSESTQPSLRILRTTSPGGLQIEVWSPAGS